MHDLTNTGAGIISLVLFFVAYALIVFEDKIHLRKAKPVLLFGTLIWMVIGIYETAHGYHDSEPFIHNLIAEIGGLFFFLLVAMTFINTLAHLKVFDALRVWLLKKGLGFRGLFWVTGLCTFILSPMADNLTSALLMSTVAAAVAGGNRKFIVPAFVNIVVAANSGGAWSPFGDITTLMVWTAGKVHTLEFAHLLIPSVVSWLVPAFIISLFVPKENPQITIEEVKMKPGARVTIFLGVLTIATAVSFHQFLHIPPFMGMMLGLSILMFVGYFFKIFGNRFLEKIDESEDASEEGFDVFRKIERVEFDTLLFFFGVLAAVGGLQYLGYLTLSGEWLYGNYGPTVANTAIGLLSAVGDNIPIMYAVLKMDPAMGLDQWLLVTLTAGVGGSVLSIGSAAGVAVMGVDRKNYTFMSHLKWAPAILLGYAASIWSWWLVTASIRAAG